MFDSIRKTFWNLWEFHFFNSRSRYTSKHHSESWRQKEKIYRKSCIVQINCIKTSKTIKGLKKFKMWYNNDHNHYESQACEWFNFLSFQFFLPFSDTDKNVKLKFYFSIKLPAQWAVSITMSCTARGLTACRLRTSC